MEAFNGGKEPKILEICDFDHDLGTDRDFGELRGPLAFRIVRFVCDIIVANGVEMSSYPVSRV